MRPALSAFLERLAGTRSLAARLTAFLALASLVPAGVFAVLYSLAASRIEERIQPVIDRDLLQDSERHLARAADVRVNEFETEAEGVLALLERASALSREVLEHGVRGGPEEPESLVMAADGTLRGGRGESAVAVSSLATRDSHARLDVARTRLVERPFLDFLTGHRSLSAAWVMTKSGVLRAVPWRDFSRFFGPNGLVPNYTLRPRPWIETRPNRGKPPLSVYWTEPYEDLYGLRGTIVSAATPISLVPGEQIAETGVDWALEEMLQRSAALPGPGEREYLAMTSGLRQLSELDRVANTGLLEAALAGEMNKSSGSPGGRSLRVGAAAYLVVSRDLQYLPWKYLRVVDVTSLHEKSREQIREFHSVVTTLRLGGALVSLSVLAVVIAAFSRIVHATLAPVRRLTAVASRLDKGDEGQSIPGLDRRDEVGELARAIDGLNSRVKRRIQSMESVHELALASSLLERSQQTYKRFCEVVANVVKANKCWLALWDPKSRRLRFTSPGFGIEDEILDSILLEYEAEGMAMVAFRTGQTHAVNDLPSEPRISRMLAGLCRVERNVVFSPLRTEMGPAGVLIVADKARDFDEEDIAAIKAHADQAALILRNARLYEELQESYGKLKEASRNRDHFLQNINHELRTPLTAIMGWSEILTDHEPDAETARMAIRQIQRSSQFLLHLISDLLDLARFEEGKAKLNLAPSDLRGLLDEALEPVQIMAEGKGIEVRVEAPEKGAAEVVCDPIRVRQVLWNLIHNATKFTGTHGVISITARLAAGGFEVAVKDTGIGIDPKELPEIFDRYRQVEGPATRAQRGTGIGLFLSKAFVDLHRGRISVKSQPGQGTEFTIFIPFPASQTKAAG